MQGRNSPATLWSLTHYVPTLCGAPQSLPHCVDLSGHVREQFASIEGSRANMAHPTLVRRHWPAISWMPSTSFPPEPVVLIGNEKTPLPQRFAF
jgi:hypothetical protein